MTSAELDRSLGQLPLRGWPTPCRCDRNRPEQKTSSRLISSVFLSTTNCSDVPIGLSPENAQVALGPQRV